MAAEAPPDVVTPEVEEEVAVEVGVEVELTSRLSRWVSWRGETENRRRSREDHVVEQGERGLPARAPVGEGERVLPARHRLIDVDGHVVEVRGVPVGRELERADLLAVDRERHVGVPEGVRGRACDDAEHVDALAFRGDRRGGCERKVSCGECAMIDSPSKVKLAVNGLAGGSLERYDTSCQVRLRTREGSKWTSQASQLSPGDHAPSGSYTMWSPSEVVPASSTVKLVSKAATGAQNEDV